MAAAATLRSAIYNCHELDELSTPEIPRRILRAEGRGVSEVPRVALSSGNTSGGGYERYQTCELGAAPNTERRRQCRSARAEAVASGPSGERGLAVHRGEIGR